MIDDKDELKPGVWIVQNLLKHQDDYRVMKIVKADERETSFSKMIVFGLSSFDEPMKAKIGKGFDIPTYFITSKSQFSLLKNVDKKYKRMIIQSILHN